MEQKLEPGPHSDDDKLHEYKTKLFIKATMEMLIY